MTWRLTAFRAACLAAMMIPGVLASARAADVVHFASAVLPPSPAELRQAKTAGTEPKQEPGTPLWGHLDKPDGAGPFPAVVLMHGCGGIHGSHARWAAQLNALGYVTLILDSFGPQSLFNICRGVSSIGSPARRALDAYGALAHLRQLPFVDADRIGLIGWSHGGISALAAVNKSGVADRFPQRYRAAIAFYPYCISDRSFDLPVLILIGEADDWTPLKPCQALQARSRDDADSTPVELVAYPGAYHAFDDPALLDGFSIRGADGRTHLLKYDQKAHEDSAKRVGSFFAEHLAGR